MDTLTDNPSPRARGPLLSRRLPAWVTTACAAAAIAGVAYFFTAVSVAEVLRPMYDPIERTISELAVGHDGFLQVTAFVALGLALLALSIGLRGRLRASRTSRPALVLLGACGVSSFVAAAFRTDLKGAAAATAAGDIHAAAAGIGYTCLILAMLLLSWHFRRDPAWRPFRVQSTVLTGLGVAALISVGAGDGSSVAGLLQRLMATALLLWVMLTAHHACRVPPAVSRTASSIASG